jgi:aspartokinase
VVALVGEGLRADPVAALRHLAALGHEPVGGLLTGSSTVSIAFLVPESRLGDLIPRLHDRCVDGHTSDDRLAGSTQLQP